jgi:hypothetical protein
MTPDSEGRQFHTGDPHELLRQYLAIYDSYHNHKEVMAYTVTAFYLGGAAALVVGSPFWCAYGVRDFVLLVSFLIVLAGIAFCFVRHQLMLRRSAGDMFKACSRLASRWLSTPPDVGALQPIDENIDPILFRGFAWPQALVLEMQQVQAARSTRWWPRDLTYTALLSSALLVLLRLFLTWRIGEAFVGSILSWL